MPGRLLVLDLALALAGCLLAAGLARELLAERPLPPAPASRAPAPVVVEAPKSPAAAGDYRVIVTKNLFSPHRAESPVAPVAAAGPRPWLHGIVMDGPGSRAYLEDPQLRRTFGYRVGDAIGVGRIETIGADRVVIAGADGRLEVFLHDPAKPKAPTPDAPPPAPAGAAPPPRVAPPRSRADER